MNLTWNTIGDIAHQIVPALLASIWQGVLLASLLWGALRFTKRLNATTAGLVWWTALLLIVALPLLNLPGRPPALPPDSGQAAVAAVGNSGNPPNPSLAGESSSVPSQPRGAIPPTATTPSPTANLASAANQTSRLSTPAIISTATNPGRYEFEVGHLPVLLLGAWSLTVLCLLARLALGLQKLHLLKQCSVPVSSELETDFRHWLTKLNFKRTVALRLSPQINSPLAAGLNQPMVLLPASLAQQLAKPELDAVTVHELAHLRRRDDWTNLSQQILQAVFCFNPAVWFVGRQIALQREIACDDWVIAFTSKPKEYATCLARLMESALPAHSALPAPGAWLTKGQMSHRVLALLDKGRNASLHRSLMRATLATAIMLLFTVACLRFGPAVAFAANPPAGGRMATHNPAKSTSKSQPSAATTANDSALKKRNRLLIQEEVTLLEKLVVALQAKKDPDEDDKIDLLKAQRDVVSLKRQLVAMDAEIGGLEIPRLEKAVKSGDRFQATHLSAKLEQLVPQNERLSELRNQVSTLPQKPHLTLDLGGGVKMEFVLIQPGYFIMGSEVNYPEERPTRGVTISKPFYLGRYEVTQEQWTALKNDNRSEFKGAKLPVEKVSWEDCQEFMIKLEKKFPKYDFDLPTEAQWEYACRAGNPSQFSFGDDGKLLIDYGWYGSNSTETHPVGEKKPNGWGLYDMHGNVWEWCADWFGFYQPGKWVRKVQPIPGTHEIKTFDINEVTDPTGALVGTHRVIRGGSFVNIPNHIRSSNRHKYTPDTQSWHIGFRCAIVGVQDDPKP